MGVPNRKYTGDLKQKNCPVCAWQDWERIYLLEELYIEGKSCRITAVLHKSKRA